MAEVYPLGRGGAIKIPHADVSNDTGRNARSEQEARAAAALKPSQICWACVAYTVTGFAAGEALAAVLERALCR
jgi:hypothetical protein